jgi:hypothetical protein
MTPDSTVEARRAEVRGKFSIDGRRAVVCGRGLPGFNNRETGSVRPLDLHVGPVSSVLVNAEWPEHKYGVWRHAPLSPALAPRYGNSVMNVATRRKSWQKERGCIAITLVVWSGAGRAERGSREHCEVGEGALGFSKDLFADFFLRCCRWNCGIPYSLSRLLTSAKNSFPSRR